MAPTKLPFELLSTEPGTKARACRFETLHGEVLTPQFMPVGTQGTVRGQTLTTLTESRSRVLLANTYHLWIRPGLEVFRQFKGLHNFMGWKGPILTDSGGFQTFSLSSSRDMDEHGVAFTSLVDGVKRLLTPEISIEAQRAIGSDIMMVLDQCVASTSNFEVSKKAMELTHRWAHRSLEARQDSPQALFAIAQGASFPELRKESASYLAELPFDGFAIGGLAVGESREMREDITELTASYLPENRPRYLMGVGTPIDLLEAVHRGIDMFDCILPTSLAQQGVAFTSRGRVDLRRAVYEKDEGPLDRDCPCSTCQTYSRGYLRHLSKCKEILGWQLIGYHNLCFYHSLTAKMREAILEKRFLAFYQANREVLANVDTDFPPSPGPKPRHREVATELGDYVVITSEAGGYALKHSTSKEVFHSVAGADAEAKALYADQSDFKRLCGMGTGEIVLWDVGLGAGSNAMAAINAFEELENPGRPLHIVSFEIDLDSFKLALRHAGRFPHLQHAAPATLLKEGAWNGKSIRWRLVEGDFLLKMDEAPAPEVIYFDPFSYKTDSDLWTLKTFKKIFACARREETQLFTYSASTAVRAKLLAAGFYVAKGIGTGPKANTTWACTNFEVFQDKASLLDAEWLNKWERSHVKFPTDIDPAHHEKFGALIRNHPQFRENGRKSAQNAPIKLTDNQQVDLFLS